MKKYIPYLTALVVFIAAACAYCLPALQGKVLGASDDITWRSVAHEGIEFSNKTGEDVWWTGSLFSGMPTFSIGGGYSLKVDKVLAPITNITNKAVNRNVWQLLFYFLGFFVLLQAFGVSAWLSIIGALAMGLSSYFIIIIPEGHNTKVATIALTAFVFGGFRFLFDKKYILGGILVMVFVSAGFSKHPQMFYYYYMMMGLVWIAEAWTHIKEKRYKDLTVATLIFIAATGIGIGTGMSNVFMNAEYVGQTTRGGSEIVKTVDGESKDAQKGLDVDYATQFSYGIDETFSLLIPGIKGGATQMSLPKTSTFYKELIDMNVTKESAKQLSATVPMYWGTQPYTAGNVYIGAIVCFLFILGLCIVKGPYKWALAAATAFAILLAWGNHFMWLTNLFFKFFPMYSKFRAVSSILIVAEIAMPLLGFMALTQVFEGKVEKKLLMRGLYISTGVIAAICLFFGLAGPHIYEFTGKLDHLVRENYTEAGMTALYDQRVSMLRGDSFRSLGLVLAAAVLLWLYAKDKLRSKAFIICVLGALIVGDLWTVDTRYFNHSRYKNRGESTTFSMEPYEETILKDNDPHFRVLNLTTQPYSDARTSYYLKSIGGYSAAKLSRYQDLIDRYLSKNDFPVISMLNTKYIIQRNEEGVITPYRNPNAMGNAWFVESVKFVDNANEELDALEHINLSTTAVVDRKFEKMVGISRPGIARNAQIKLTKYTPNTLDFMYTSSKDGIVVFSEIYYPYGWKATIDDKPVDIFRANYVLRGLQVPMGTHNIHFEFDPDSVHKGDNLALGFSVLMYLLVIGGIAFSVYERFKKKKEDKEKKA